jgi:hypothetical protein
VVAIDSTGRITAKSKGKAFIFTKAGTKTKRHRVTVR